MKTIKRILAGIGTVVVGVVFYLTVVALMPGFPTPLQKLTPKRPKSDDEEHQSAQRRRDVNFDVDGTSISAWLYLPADKPDPSACIVMAHGLGGTKAKGLERYAERFQDAGFAALVFDYRGWGDSDGEPRGLIWVPNQLADYAAAVAYARGREEIDEGRIALWGTSFSGGHVVATAARDQRIACVVAQCPALDGHAAVEMAFKRVGLDLRVLVHAQRDLVRSWLGLSPHKIPVVGRPGDVALMTTPDAVDAYEELLPPDYVNEACARIAIRADKYRPVKQASAVRCPALFQICGQDDLVPVSSIEQTAEIMGALAEVKRYPIDHFAIYTGKPFETSVTDQVTFFRKHL
jgi:dienelactone hydrolase